MASQELLVTLGLASNSFSKKMKEILKEVKQFDHELDEANNSVKGFAKTQEGVATKLNKLQNKFETLGRATELYKQEKSKLTQELYQSQKAFITLDKQIGETKTKLERHNTVLANSQSNYDKAKAGMTNLESSYKSVGKEVSSLEKVLAKEIKAYDDMQNKQLKSAESIRKMEDSFNKLQSTLDKQTMAYDKSNRKLEETEKKINTLKKAVSTSEAVYKESSNQVKTLTQELKRAEDVYGKNADETKKYASALKEAQQMQRMAEKEVSKLNKELDKARDTWTKTSDTIKKQADNMAKTSKEMYAMEQKISKANTELKEFSKAMDKSALSIRETQDKLGRLKNNYEQLGKAVANQKAKLESAKSSLNSNKANVEALKTELARLESEYLKTGKAVQTTASKLKSVNSDYAKHRAEVNKLNLEIQETQRKMATLRWDNISDGLGKTADRISKFSAPIRELGDSLTAGLSVPIAGFVGIASKTFMEFEQQMYKVNAIIDKGSLTSEQSFNKLSDSSRKFAKETQYTANEVGEAYGFMAMAGWDLEKSTANMRPMLDLATIGMVDLGVASDIVTDSMTSFQNTGITAKQFVDVFAKTITIANTDVETMGETLKYVAPVMGSLGATFEDTSVAIGLMANAGIKGSQAGTSLASGFTRLIKPSKEAKKVMEKYGIVIQKNKDGQVDLMGTMQHLRAKLGGLSEDEKAVAVSTLFGLTAMKGWLPIINATTDDFNKLSNEIKNAGGITEEVMAEMEKSGAYTFKILLSNIQDFLISVGDALAPAFKDIAGWLTEATGKLSEWVQKMQETSPETLALIGKLGLFAVVIPPILSLIGRMGDGFSTLMSLGSGLAKGMSGLKGRMGEVAGVTDGANTKFLTLIKAFMKTPVGIGIAVGSLALLMSAIGDNQRALAELQETWGGFGEFVGRVCETVSGVVQIAFAFIGQGLSTVGKAIVALLKGKWKEIDNIVAEGGAKMAMSMNEGMSKVKGEATRGMKLIREANSSELSEIERVWQYSMDRLPNLTYDNLDKTSNLFGKMLGGVSDETFTMLRGTSDTMARMLAGISENTADKGAVIRKNLENMLLSGSTSADKLKQDLEKTMGLVNEYMADSTARFGETAQSMFDKLSETSKFGAENVATRMVESLQKMDADTVTTLSQMGESWKSIFDGIATDGSMETDHMVRLITSRIQAMAKENPEYLSLMKDEMTNYLGLLKEQGNQEVGLLQSGISEKMQSILLSTDGIGRQIVENLDISDASTMTQEQLNTLNMMLSQSGLDAVSMEEGRKIVDSILQSMSTLPENAGTVMDNTKMAIEQGTSSIGETMYNTGSESVSNLNQGIIDNVGTVSTSTGEISNALSSIDNIQLGNVTKQLSNIKDWLSKVKAESSNTANGMKNLTNLPFGNTTKGLQQTHMWIGRVATASKSTASSMKNLTNLPFGNTTKGLSEVNRWLGTVKTSSTATTNGLKAITKVTYGSVTKGLSQIDRWLVASNKAGLNVNTTLRNLSQVRFGGLVSSLNSLISALNRVKSTAGSTRSAVISVQNARSSLPRMVSMPQADVQTQELNPMARSGALDMSRFKTSGGWYVPQPVPTTSAPTQSSDNESQKELIRVLTQQNQLLIQLLTADRNINVNMEVSGRSIATATAPYMNKEIEKLNKRNSRLGGVTR